MHHLLAQAVHLVSTQAETGPHRGDALAKWVSRDGPCSTAALHGDSLAIGLVTSVQLLEVQQNGSSLQEQQQLQFLHQVSAVSLCQQASKVWSLRLPITILLSFKRISPLLQC